MTVVLLPLQGANIGRRVDAAQTHGNIARVRHGIPSGTPGTVRGPAVCWQEVNDDNAPVDERGDIDALFPRPDFTTWPRFDHRVGCLVPVTVPAPWEMEDHWAHLISHGLAHVSPDRYVTVRVERHPDLPAPLAFVSWQFVQGAHTDPGQAHEEYRTAAFHDGLTAVRREVRALVRDGITVAYAADTNDPHCPLLRWDDVRVIQQGLDALGYVPGRGKAALTVQPRRTWRVPLNIDGHDGTGALLALS